MSDLVVEQMVRDGDYGECEAEEVIAQDLVAECSKWSEKNFPYPEEVCWTIDQKVKLLSISMILVTV